MKSTRSRHQRLGCLLIIILIVTLVSLCWPSAGTGDISLAYAVTSAEKQAEVDEALKRLDALQTELNQLASDYDAAVLARQEAEARMLDARTREEAAV